jgi:CheY-like chemotaxis protein
VLDYLVKPVTQADLQKTLEKVPAHRRILLIDDNPEVVMLWTRMLRLLDDQVEIESAATGRGGLDAMRRGGPDLVLLDIILPDFDGWQVLTEKNADANIAGIPVVLVTAQDPEDEPARSEALVITMDGGLSVAKLLRGAVAASAIMLGPD